MLVQVKHRGWGFIQVFIIKIRGRGRVVHTGEGRDIFVIGKENKVKPHNNCFYGRKIYPEVRELQYLLQDTEIHTSTYE